MSAATISAQSGRESGQRLFAQRLAHNAGFFGLAITWVFPSGFRLSVARDLTAPAHPYRPDDSAGAFADSGISARTVTVTKSTARARRTGRALFSYNSFGYVGKRLSTRTTGFALPAFKTRQEDPRLPGPTMPSTLATMRR